MLSNDQSTGIRSLNDLLTNTPKRFYVRRKHFAETDFAPTRRTLDMLGRKPIYVDLDANAQYKVVGVVESSGVKVHVKRDPGSQDPPLSLGVPTIVLTLSDALDLFDGLDKVIVELTGLKSTKLTRSTKAWLADYCNFLQETELNNNDMDHYGVW